MDRKSRTFIILFGIITAVFIFELVQLFILRFEFGDVYPAYSSFRSDPLGVRAFYGAADSLEDVSVLRNMEPVSKLDDGRDTTLLFCGSSMTRDPEEVIEALEALVAEGARLVIAFYPVKKKPVSWLEMEDEEEEGGKPEDIEEGEEGEDVKAGNASGGKGSSEDEADEDEEEKDACVKEPWCGDMVSIEDRWGFIYGYSGLPDSQDSEFGVALAGKQSGPDDLPESLSWHTAMFFDDLDDAWNTLYTREDLPVIVERQWGRGTIVLSSDTYFLSNEAMREERHPDLLAWLIGPSSTVIFDEAHLGIRESRGIMALIRGYRLTGVLGVFVLLAGLFVWRNAVSLVPKSGDGSPDDSRLTRGRDSAEGLVNLLRRSIPSRDVIRVCVEELKRSFTREAGIREARRARIQAIVDREKSLPIRRHDPVAAYRSISKILAERD